MEKGSGEERFPCSERASVVSVGHSLKEEETGKGPAEEKRNIPTDGLSIG